MLQHAIKTEIDPFRSWTGAGRHTDGYYLNRWGLLADELEGLGGVWGAGGTPVASLPPAPPTVWLVHSVNGQPAGPSPYPCAGVHKPP